VGKKMNMSLIQQQKGISPMITLQPKSNFLRRFRLLALSSGILGLLVFVLSGCNVERTNFDLTTANTRVCTIKQRDDWNFIHDFQMGVAARDPVGEQIGSFPRKSGTIAGGPWVPYRTKKTTLCGTLHHFNFTDPWGNEDDWNNYIIPSEVEPFRRLLTDPLTFGWADPDHVHNCATAHDCMEAELTPDQDFRGNPWFPRVFGDERDQSPLEGEQLCTYGPYVADSNEDHGNRPEIHPSELYWFQSPPDEFGRGTVTTLMLLQDDSERFDRPSDYDLPDTPPDGWRPWAAFPRTGEFSLAFEVTIGPVDGSVQILNFDISEAPKPFGRKAVVTSAITRLDADNGTEHAITYNGQTVLQVRELQPNDDDIGVQFKDVCRIDDPIVAKTRLQGYVTLTSMVGENDKGGEGFLVLNVNAYERENPNPPVILASAKVVPVGKILRETIHPAVVKGKTEILADLQVSLMGRPDEKESDLKIVQVERVVGGQRQDLVLTSFQREAGSYESQGVVKDVPVASGAKLEVTTESGKVLYLSTPPISLAPANITESLLRTSNDPMVWNSMVVGAGGNPQETIPPPDQLKKVSQWQLQVTPVYALFKDGQAYLEDDSPVAEELNEMISRGDALRLKEFFGSGRPFSVEWSFEAKNLATGGKVPVNTAGNAASTEVQVQILRDESLTEGLKITFPEEPENALFELIVTARMKDTLGNTSEVQHTLWSHALVDRDENKLVGYIIPTVAVLAGVSPDDLLAAGRLDLQADESGRTPPDSKYTVAQMLRLIAMQAAEDGRISVSELASLIRGARLFGSQ
jgi:hypothetical protein